MNQIRSPMAEALMKQRHGRRIFVQSAGLRGEGEVDGFAAAVMDEIGLDILSHRPRSFDELEDDFFDVVVSLSPEAQHRAVELTRHSSCEIMFWPTLDPSLVHGGREQRLEAYRAVRDQIAEKIDQYFPRPDAPRF